MDFRAKQVLIIGGFCTAIGLISISLESQDFWKNQYSDSEYYASRVRRNTIQLALHVKGTLFSILLIRGVLKRRLILMTPWLIAAFAGATFLGYYAVMALMFISFESFEFLLPCLVITAIATLIFHPVLSLFREIWLENLEAKKQRIQDQLNYEKKMKSGKVDMNVKAVV